MEKHYFLLSGDALTFREVSEAEAEAEEDGGEESVVTATRRGHFWRIETSQYYCGGGVFTMDITQLDLLRAMRTYQAALIQDYREEMGS